MSLTAIETAVEANKTDELLSIETKYSVKGYNAMPVFIQKGKGAKVWVRCSGSRKMDRD